MDKPKKPKPKRKKTPSLSWDGLEGAWAGDKGGKVYRQPGQSKPALKRAKTGKRGKPEVDYLPPKKSTVLKPKIVMRRVVDLVSIGASPLSRARRSNA